MGLRILHTADWHMDAPFVSFSEAQRSFLHRQQLALPEKIAEICRREQCDLVLLAGDIFDGIPSREAVDCVRNALADCAVPVFVSPGNHDFCGVGCPWVEEWWPENVTVFRGGLESLSLPALDCRIYGAGYQSMDCPALLEGFQAAGSETWQIALLHGDPVTAGSPYCPISAPQIRTSGLSYLALGHIHSADALQCGPTLCAWPGCPMGRGWDETGEKGVWIADLAQTQELRFVPLDGPRFYDLEADVSDGAEDVLDAMLPAGGSDDFFRVTLTGQWNGDVQALDARYTRLPNRIFRDRTEPEADPWAEAGDDTLRGTYFQRLKESGDPSALLAAKISQKILAGREVKLP